jgi:DNA polymerase-3 subunit alpha
MGGIKGVGEGVVEAIVQERKKGGVFHSLFDFCRRIDTKKVGKKMIELLIEAGCFDFTGSSREAMVQAFDAMYEMAVQRQKEAAKGFIDLFGDTIEEIGVVEVAQKTTTRAHLLRREKELLGFYVTGHPLDEYKNQIQRLSCTPFSHIHELAADSLFRAVFIVDVVQMKISSKNQKKFAILQISDGLFRFEVPVWSDLIDQKGHLLSDNQLLYAILQVDRRDGELKLQCRWFDELARVSDSMLSECDRMMDQLRVQQKSASFRDKKQGKKVEKEQPSQKLFLKLDIDKVRLSHLLDLKDLFRRFPGKTPLMIEFACSLKTHGQLHIDQKWGVTLEKELETQLKKLPSLLNYRVS